MSRLALSLFGPPRIECNGEPIEIDRRKAMALIVYLAVTGRSHSRDTLATLFWPEHDQSRARAGLRRALAALKQALGQGWLDVDRETVGLNRGAEVWLDVNEFRDWLAECRTHGHPPEEVCPACLPPLTEAATLYRDDFLAGFTLRDSHGFDEWQFFQTEGLRNELASALERLAHGYSDRGEFERAIAYARRRLALDPLHEPVHRHLMRLYDWSGQRTAALRQYRECEQVLKEELGVPPQEETTQVYQAIKENRGLPPPVDRFATPVLPRKATRKHNLPVQPTPFVGREAELAELGRLLADPDVRLVTILGAGGMGKTRLALEAAIAQVDNFTHGVFFVPLAPLQSVEAIVPTVAEALGFSFYGEDEPQQQLLDYLHQKTMLLILDSFEHLLACPEPSRRDSVGAVTEILKTAPDVKTLTTSRARLNVQGEHLFPIAGMEFPDRETTEDAIRYSAVKLFLHGARWVQPGFELKDGDLTDVARICRLVQGMPLGILLAAAWVGMLTPAEIAAEIGQSLDFLETDLRDVPERQRSIRAVFDHSWNLLTEREREVFQGLSVFRGGFTREAAQQVTGASLRELMALVNKSLLHRTPAPSATPSTPLRAGGRYEVHELLREYAAEKLDQSPAASRAVHDRHCAYYAAALQRREDDLRGPWRQTALAGADAEIEADSENARAAWNWAVERGQVERLEQAMEGLCRFYDLHWRYQEGEAACRMAAERLAATMSGDGPVLPVPSIAEGSAACPELRRRVEGLRVLAKVLTWQGSFNRGLGRAELASQLLRQSLTLLEGPELADQDTRPEKALVLLQMGHIVIYSDREEARRLYEQSLALYQALGDRYRCETAYVMRILSGIAGTLDASGEARQLLGQFAEAHSLLKESVAIYNDLGFRDNIAFSNTSLGGAKVHLGRYESARAQGQMGLALSQEIGYRRGIGYSCWLLGCVALAVEAYAEAQQLLQESVTIYQEIGQREESGWALATLGYAARGLGNMPEAQQCLCEALQTATQIGAFMSLMLALPAIALLLADQGEKERAVELYALASRYPFVANSHWFEDIAGRHIAAVAATLPPDVVAAAQARGQARDLEATVAKLLVELGR